MKLSDRQKFALAVRRFRRELSRVIYTPGRGVRMDYRIGEVRMDALLGKESQLARIDDVWNSDERFPSDPTGLRRGREKLRLFWPELAETLDAIRSNVLDADPTHLQQSMGRWADRE